MVAVEKETRSQQRRETVSWIFTMKKEKNKSAVTS